MRAKFVFGVLFTLLIGFYGYSWEVKRLTTTVGAAGPEGIVDAVGVKFDLLTIAGAEQQQFALEGKYLPLDQLRARGVPIAEGRGAYVFSADVSADTFLIRATLKVPAGTPPRPDVTVGPDMKVKEAPPLAGDAARGGAR